MSRDASKIVIVNVDQPRPADFTRAIIEALGSDAHVAVPTHNGRRGHPVAVSGQLREEMLNADEQHEGLRGIITAHEEALVEVPFDDLCELDLNTPDDYAAARERFGLGALTT